MPELDPETPITQHVARCREGACTHLRRGEPGHADRVEKVLRWLDGLSDTNPGGLFTSTGPVIYQYGRRLPRKLKKLARGGGLVITRYKRA